MNVLAFTLASCNILYSDCIMHGSSVIVTLCYCQLRTEKADMRTWYTRWQLLYHFVLYRLQFQGWGTANATCFSVKWITSELKPDFNLNYEDLRFWINTISLLPQVTDKLLHTKSVKITHTRTDAQTLTNTHSGQEWKRVVYHYQTPVQQRKALAKSQLNRK